MIVSFRFHNQQLMVFQSNLLRVSIVLLLFLCSVYSHGQEIKTPTGAVYTIETEDGKYGIQASDGIWLLKPTFIHIKKLNSQLILTKSDGVGIYNLDQKKWIVERADEYASTNAFYKLAEVIKNGKIGLVDLEAGHLLAPIEYDVIEKSLGGALYISKGSKIGLVYKAGKAKACMIDAVYDEIIPLARGSAKYYLLHTGDNAKILGIKENVILHEFDRFEDVLVTNASLMFFKSNGYWQVFNSYSKILSESFQNFQYSNKGHAHILVKKNNLWGIVSRKQLNSFLVEPQYDSIAYVGMNFYKIINAQGKVGLINEMNELLVPANYEDINLTGIDNQYFVRQNSKFSRYTDGANSTHQFDSIIGYGYSNGSQIVSNSGKYGLYNSKFDSILIGITHDDYEQITCDKPYDVYMPMILLGKKDAFSLYSYSGKLLTSRSNLSYVDCISTDIVVVVNDSGTRYLINTNGHEIRLPKYDHIHWVSGCMARLTIGNRLTFITHHADKYHLIPGLYEGDRDWPDYNPIQAMKIVKKDGKWSWVDMQSFQSIYPFIFDEIEKFDGNDSTTVTINGQKKTLHSDGLITEIE